MRGAAHIMRIAFGCVCVHTPRPHTNACAAAANIPGSIPQLSRAAKASGGIQVSTMGDSVGFLFAQGKGGGGGGVRLTEEVEGER